MHFAGQSRAIPREVCLIILSAILALSGVSVPGIAKAQDPAGLEQGLKPYGSYDGGDLDSISLVNGGLDLHIPLVSYPQRGGKLNISFTVGFNPPSLVPTGNYFCPDPQDSSVCYPDNVHYLWAVAGWNNISIPDLQVPGVVVKQDFVPQLRQNTAVVPQGPCSAPGAPPPGEGSCVTSEPSFIDYSITEPDGADHHLGQIGTPTNYSNWLARDASGYSMNVNTLTYTNREGIRYVGSGTTQPTEGGVPYGPPICCGQLTAIEDPNGNRITPNLVPSNNPIDPAGTTYLTGWTDTLGRSIPLPPPIYDGNYLTGVTMDYSNCSGPLPTVEAYVWNVPGPNGNLSQFKICYASTPFNATLSNCAASTCSLDGGASTVYQIQSIVLPNLTTWTFAYYTSGVSSGLLQDITLPTGGTISYVWGVNANCTTSSVQTGYLSSFPVIHFAVTQRTITDATGSHTWNYSPQQISGSFTIQNVVTDPLGNDTVHTISDLGSVCANLYETEADRYTGSHTNGTLLQKTLTQYSSVPDPYPAGSANSQGGVMNIVPQSITTVDVPTGINNETTKVYDTGIPMATGWQGPYVNITGPMPNIIFGDMVQQNDYDFGSGAAGNLLRQTNTTYMAISGPNAASYLANNLLTLPYTKQICDGSQNQYALTQYNYDETSLVPSGLSGTATLNAAPPSSPYFGNNTSTQQWLSSGTGQCQANATVGTGASVSSHRAFFDTGMIYTSYDPLGNPTQYTYSTAYQGAYPTQVKNALGQIEQYQYDLNIGVKTTSIDVNSQPTGYTYDVMGRLTNVQYPDGGALSYCYSDVGLPLCQGALHAPSVLMAKGQNAGTSSSLSWPVTQPGDASSQQVEADVDGLGRKIRVVSLTDTTGADEIDTSYDALGRVQSVSNPYDSSSEATYGITSYQYDALGRTLYQCEPDNAPSTAIACVPNNSYLQWSYSGNVVDSYDETGRHWQRTSDGLGRLTKVLEPDGSVNTSSLPSLETDYGYDPLGNLRAVTQNGLKSEGVRGRSFNYDSLSRLTSSLNPETGTITYSYDLDSNLIQKVSQDPNAVSGNVTLGYCYDGLNRLVSKFYEAPNCTNTGSAVANYQYDSSSISGAAFTVGRLTSETSSIAGTVVSQRSPYLYDVMGRVQAEQQCPYAPCATPYLFQYAYDVAGNVIDSNNGLTGTNAVYLASGYDGMGRLSATNSSAVGVTPALTLFQAVAQSGANPYSAVGLTNAQLGVNTTNSTVAINLARTYDSRLRLVSENDQGELQASAATGSAGTITITGNEQSIPASTYATAQITVTGTEGSHQVCITTTKPTAPGKPPVPITICSTVYDTGNLSIVVTVNGTPYTATAPYSQTTTDATLASTLATALTGTGVVQGSFNGSVVTMTSDLIGQGGNYSFQITNGADFDGSSSTATNTMTGGLTATSDTGYISITYGTAPAMIAPWGASDNLTTVIASVMSAINNSGELTATNAGNGTLLLNSVGKGAATNQPLLVSITDTATEFSSPSFAVSHTQMSGGTDAVYSNGTVYSYNLAGNYASNGNLLGYRDQAMGTWVFGYDNLNRLTTSGSSTAPFLGETVCWSYDSFGNRLGETVSTNPCPVPAPSLPSPVNNQLAGLSYAAAGNVTGDGVNLYLYDEENRVCAVQGAYGGGLTGYIYDAEGQRVAKGTLSSFSCPNASNFTLTNQYLLGQGNEEVTELDEQGNPKHTDVYAAGRLLATYDTNGLHFELSDWLGTKRVQTNASGVMEETCTSLPFGNNQSCIGASDATEKHFTGKERDQESGLDYFGARYYASNMGRWMSPDWSAKAEPVPYSKLYDPQTLNLYGYVGNNPLSRGDMDGHHAMNINISDQAIMEGEANSQQNDYNHSLAALDDGLKDYDKKWGSGAQPQSSTSSTSTTGTTTQDHYVSIGYWPTGAGGFGHIGVQVDSDDTQGYSTKDPSVHWWQRLFGAPAARTEDDIAQHTTNGDTATHFYHHISITADQATQMQAAMAARTENPGHYNLLFNNCAGFVESVLRSGGVWAPHAEIFGPPILYGILSLEH